VRRLFLIAVLAVVAALPSHAERKPTPRWETLPMPPAMPAATSTGFVAVDNAKIFYATYGKGTTPVILLHGGLGNSDHWGFQLPALVENYKVIAIDSRGQGRSTIAAKTKLTYHVMANDVLAVMDKLEIDTAALVGWSDGGAIALDLAINHPKRVTKLFVFGTNYHADGSKPRRGPAAKTFNAYAVKCKSDFMKMAKAGSSYETTVNALLPIWRSAGGFTKEQMRSIKAPTVISDGDHDEIIFLDHIKEMSMLIPNAKLVVFENASHFALWQAPEAFNKAVVEFLDAGK
jgi:pimeloyl-ACP methyl ester carboxylesterase